MTTAAQIRSAWETYVFQNSDISAITSKYYKTEVTQESEAEVALGYNDSQINFFEFVVTPQQSEVNQISGSANSRLQTFLVEVRYTKYAEPNGTAFNDVIDALETLIDTVRTSLGATWQGLVDFVQNPISVEPPQKQKFNETDCYRAVIRFTAQKQI